LQGLNIQVRIVQNKIPIPLPVDAHLSVIMPGIQHM
jgi:hypothetical protein